MMWTQARSNKNHFRTQWHHLVMLYTLILVYLHFLPPFIFLCLVSVWKCLLSVCFYMWSRSYLNGIQGFSKIHIKTEWFLKEKCYRGDYTATRWTEALFTCLETTAAAQRQCCLRKARSFCVWSRVFGMFSVFSPRFQPQKRLWGVGKF